MLVMPVRIGCNTAWRFFTKKNEIEDQKGKIDL
jgi:hypothetical protein